MTPVRGVACHHVELTFQPLRWATSSISVWTARKSPSVAASAATQPVDVQLNCGTIVTGTNALAGGVAAVAVGGGTDTFSRVSAVGCGATVSVGVSVDENAGRPAALR